MRKRRSSTLLVQLLKVEISVYLDTYDANKIQYNCEAGGT